MERHWIKKIKRSASEEAANKLISKYYKEINAFIYKQTLDNELTLDLTQEILEMGFRGPQERLLFHIPSISISNQPLCVQV